MGGVPRPGQQLRPIRGLVGQGEGTWEGGKPAPWSVPLRGPDGSGEGPWEVGQLDRVIGRGRLAVGAQ